MFIQLYPPSLVKTLLGDYGIPHTAALQWGCDHELGAIQQYMLLSASQVEESEFVYFLYTLCISIAIQ